MQVNDTVLTVNKLTTSFFTHIGEVQAVRGVDLYVQEGESLGIVGESGCGKSVTMLSILNILDQAGRVKSGEILFQGKALHTLPERKMQNIRGNDISMIFQDPMTSLNPVYKVGDQMTEHLCKHTGISRRRAMKEALDMLKEVGIPSPEDRLNQYPLEFSGGMRQRVMIAMALITKPKLLIADEPTTALDVTIQAQIMEIMKKVCSELKTAIILITHDLGIVADLCDRVNVMYGGIIVERASVDDIYEAPGHPYTIGLLDSVPNPKAEQQERLRPIKGQPPDLLSPPVGCPFAPRCTHTMKICIDRMPPLYFLGEGHEAACWLHHTCAAGRNI